AASSCTPACSCRSRAPSGYRPGVRAAARKIGPANAKNNTTASTIASAAHFAATNAHSGNRYCFESRSPLVCTTIVTLRFKSPVERRTKDQLEETGQVVVGIERNVDLPLPFRAQRH